MLIHFLAWNLLEVPRFCFTSCVRWIYGVPFFYQFGHSCLHLCRECCFTGYYEQGRIARCDDVSFFINIGMAVAGATIIRGCIFSMLLSDFRACGPISITRIVFFFHADTETNAHPLVVSWYLISSLWMYRYSCMHIMSILDL